MDADTLMTTADISYRQLDYWTRRGYITTVGDPTPGSGYSRRYPHHEVLVTMVMARMVEAGFEVGTAAVLARDAVDLANEHGIFGLMLPGGFALTGLIPDVEPEGGDDDPD